MLASLKDFYVQPAKNLVIVPHILKSFCWIAPYDI